MSTSRSNASLLQEFFRPMYIPFWLNIIKIACSDWGKVFHLNEGRLAKFCAFVNVCSFWLGPKRTTPDDRRSLDWPRAKYAPRALENYSHKPSFRPNSHPIAIGFSPALARILLRLAHIRVAHAPGEPPIVPQYHMSVYWLWGFGSEMSVANKYRCS